MLYMANGGSFGVKELVIQANDTLDLGTATLVATTYTHNGIIRTANTSATPIPNRTWTGAIEYYGATEQFINNTNNRFANIIVSNTAGVSVSASTENTGTLTINPGGLLSITGTAIWSCKGHIVNNGSFTVQATARMYIDNATPNHQISGSGSFGDLEIRGPSTIISSIKYK
jgi:hypothetical protein